jgi:hypothetical protein
MDPADLPPGSSKPEMLYGLQEWVVEMVDRVFSVLDNVPSLKKGFYMGQVRDCKPPNPRFRSTCSSFVPLAPSLGCFTGQ